MTYEPVGTLIFTKLLHEIKASPEKTAALMSCLQCGFTIQDHVQVFLEQEKKDPYEIRQVLAWLEMPPAPFQPLLKVATPQLLSCEDYPPPSCWVLTDLGVEVLKQLNPGVKVKVPKIRAGWNLARRYLALKFQTSVDDKKAVVQINQTLYSKAQQIRPDVLISLPDKLLILEIEQKFSRKNLAQAERKLENWERYISVLQKAGEQRPWHIYLALDVPDRSYERVLSLWQEALTRVVQNQGELSYTLSYLWALEIFDSNKLGEFLAHSVLLEPTGDALWREEEEYFWARHMA